MGPAQKHTSIYTQGLKITMDKLQLMNFIQKWHDGQLREARVAEES